MTLADNTSTLPGSIGSGAQLPAVLRLPTSAQLLERILWIYLHLLCYAFTSINVYSIGALRS